MAPGYVYILTNPSMPGMLKIGRVLRDSRSRARKLHTTGVPTPFELAFEIFSKNCRQLERQMHERLGDFRVNDHREFFRYPLNDAINLLLQLNGVSTRPEDNFSAVSILDALKQKYPTWMDPSLADVRIVQTDDRVWLETMTEQEIGGYLKDQTIKRTDLGFICDDDKDDNPFFRFTDLVTKNAQRFTEELGPFSIMMTTDLFHGAANHEINVKFNPLLSRTKNNGEIS